MKTDRITKALLMLETIWLKEGVIEEICLGCGKVNCGGCPCGTEKSIKKTK